MDDDREDPGPYNPRNNRGRGRNAHRGGRFPLGVNARMRRPGEQQVHRGPHQHDRPARGRLPPLLGPQGNRNHAPFNRENNPPREQQSGSNDNHQRNYPRKQFVGFKKLEEIANSDTKETLNKLMESKQAFIDLIQSPIEKCDMFVVIMEIIAKISQSAFDETKSRMLIDICNSNFIVSLKSYLMDLPYVQSKSANNLYWKDQESQVTFWRHFVDFCECLVNTLPSTALNKCRSLLEATSIACLDGLNNRHNFVLPEEYANKLVELRERMAEFEKRSLESKPSKGFRYEEGAPPENFRELSIMPTREDLLQRSYIRPNIVDGGYQDVEHYLDVQFRLLREDCFGPLRDGLNQFLHDQGKKRQRYDNIRVFQDVKFLKPYVSQTKVGSLVQLDVRHNKMFRRTSWANNKRFIFGSLLLFTKDNCKTFIAATILDREEDYLLQGMIPVSIIGQGFDINLYNDDQYTMIESEVYFEPYFHVLKVLQDPTFPEHLSMKQYIVHVNPQPQPPSYLTEDTKFTVETLHTKDNMPDVEDLRNILDHIDDKTVGEMEFTVLNEDTWPMTDELSFNESQYDAYQLSLTHEFAVVQGPPGTGKTYLGIKVAKTLFENLKSTSDCLMLVICYTNHALDQFLEALLGITDSIVRIGGQSRNEAMEQINLNKLRRQVSVHGAANKAFFEQKMSLKDSISEFQRALVKLDVLLNGVIKCDYIKEDVHEAKLLSSYYGEALGGRDPLYYWLFEHSAHFSDDVNYLLQGNDVENDFAKHEKESRKRTGVMLDDEDKDNAQNNAYRTEISSFSMDVATLEIKKLVAQYRNTQDEHIKQNIIAQLQFLESYKTMFNEMSVNRRRRIDLRITAYTNFSQISTIDRWSLYFTWIRKHTRDARAGVGRLLEEVNTASTMFEESRMMLDMRVLADRKIVGMTTSGAARVRKLLQALNPPIVIVEEAAEVLEQHIITSLTDGCKHLILIGDHQQLRPSASHMKLARHYNLEVSLFERMINNGIHSRRLSVQHRMRPEIAALICPHIYPDLENHPSVYDFPDVKGITKNMYFFDHQFKEERVEDNMSRTNHREADLTLALANYLVQQGYSTEEVTILSAYKGQMFYMRKESDKYSHLRGVKITVVDNYQGEESRIILLSLVRHNDDNKIGFLGTANRICVALSRAKEGFYIFGNIEILKSNSDLWKNIATTLESSKSLGSNLVLQCQAHTDNMTIIEKLEDFQNVPEGGCLLPCEKVLRCGHKCLLMCHGYDRRHNTAATKCTLKCERILCLLNHVCPKKCAVDCGPCKRRVEKKLPCGHVMQVYCYQEPEDPDIKCNTEVEVTLPDCKHKVNKLCFQNIRNVRCPVACEFRVEKCGHSCQRKCHVKDDPKHEKYLCMKPCAKAKRNCKANLEGDRGDHQCRNKCHETCDTCKVQMSKQRSSCKHKLTTECNVDPDTVPCLKKCARSLPCTHFCKKLCKEPCGDCNEQVTKTIPDCKHEVKMACKYEPARKYCKKNCERTLSCGHRCKGRCADECDATKCMEPSTRKLMSPCGHLVTLPCNVANLPVSMLKVEQLLGWCETACAAELACGHVCAGSCARCLQGRLHLPCSQTCNQINICQHLCEEPCNQICPPCNKPCEIKCQHSQCNQRCGTPCKSCKEKCGRRCRHGACSHRCGEECSVSACNEACDLTLSCGHVCRGMCGQPCPPVCSLCSPDTFPVDFLGDPFEDTDRFVLLEDCGHVMEVENMDNLMKGDSETVKIRCCPFCRKPIINTGRYKDLVNATFKNEINVIKLRVYGTHDKIQDAKQKLRADLGSYLAKYETELKENNTLKSIFMSLRSIVKTQKKVSKLQIDMELVCLNILDMLSECYKSYTTSKATELNTEVMEQIKLLCKIFIFNPSKITLNKISEQQQKDVRLEIRRLNAIIQLAKLLSHGAYAPVKNLPTVAAAFKAANEAVFEPSVFKETETMAALKRLQEAVKVSGVVTKQERDLIVKAIGLKAGHWYKCPNGHFYCIGECGGAMERGKCPECGVTIGGGSHRLVEGNQHAPEMDGSRFAAWSEQYNNMANFDI